MKKILMIGLTSNIGGIETCIFNYYKRLDKDKFQIDFINRSSSKLAFQDEILSNNVRIFQITSYYKSRRKYAKELYKILCDNNYDIIYINFSSIRFIEPLTIAHKYGKAKIYVHVHNAHFDKNIKNKIMNYFNKNFIPYLADVYLACSNAAAKRFYNKKIINSNNFHIITNIIDKEAFELKSDVRNEIRNKYKLDNSFVIGQVAKFSKNKNQLFTVRLLEELLKKNANTKLILIGKYTNKDKAIKYINKHELSDKVILTGLVNNVNLYLNAFDAFIFSSLNEGYGTALIEAQMYNIPCYASNTIPKETNITNAVHFLDLNKGAKYWADYIIKTKDNINNRKIKYEIDKYVKQFDDILSSK